MTDREAMEKAFSKAFDEGCKVKTNSGYFGGDTDEKTRVMYKSIWDSALAYAEGQWVRCDERLPERKKGWNHTDEVLVWYEGGEQKIAKYGIAYYHYDPPHRAPEWVDFANLGRVPWMWKAIVRPEKGGDVDARTG